MVKPISTFLIVNTTLINSQSGSPFSFILMNISAYKATPYLMLKNLHATLFTEKFI